ncbi:MAG: TatD family hydrolase [Chloroflexi bacterium]|nr:TatD family hydrolase [Chloroflexota bacterium]
MLYAPVYQRVNRMLIDCHVHLESYPDDEIEGVLARGRDAGVGFVISAGTTLKSSERTVQISARFPDLFAGVGIHPMDIEAPFTDETYAALHRLATSSEKVIVISEIGLDFMEGAPDRSIQYPALREQIRLARDLGLPIVFHSRDSHDEIFRVLREERAYEVGGVMHYFQGDERTAKTAIDLGFYISLARPLLRLPHLQEVAAGLSLDNVVLETDSAPQPFKAKRESWTEPRHTRVVAEKLAELQGRTVEEIEEITSRNMKDVLAGKWPVVQGYLDSAQGPS